LDITSSIFSRSSGGDYAQRTSQHGGLLVVRHGWLVYAKYYGKGHRDATPSAASVGKTYTTMTSGMYESAGIPGIVRGEKVKLDQPPPMDRSVCILAAARIEGDSVIVPSMSVPDPKAAPRRLGVESCVDGSTAPGSRPYLFGRTTGPGVTDKNTIYLTRTRIRIKRFIGEVAYSDGNVVARDTASDYTPHLGQR
jgi:hypothetical protein